MTSIAASIDCLFAKCVPTMLGSQGRPMSDRRQRTRATAPLRGGFARGAAHFLTPVMASTLHSNVRQRSPLPSKGSGMAQSSAGLHESAQQLSPELIDRHRAIVSLMEELEAVDWYDQRIEACQDAELGRILIH